MGGNLTTETIFVMCRVEIEYETDEARDNAIDMALRLPLRSCVGAGKGGEYAVATINTRLCPPCFQPNWDKEVQGGK